jgi:hypothetical protein
MQASKIRLERIVPGTRGDLLNGVLVVFIATHPEQRSQRIVGWYRNATVYRNYRPSPPKERNGFNYFLVAEALLHALANQFEGDPAATDSTRVLRLPGFANKKYERSASTGPRELSQSERDWAYAKRALSRGVPPEEIMRDIAEFRAHDKHDPADYARRTVTKAQIEAPAWNSLAGGDLDARPAPTENNERSP